jgi:DNA-binding transcriptional LysR family regulator
MGLDGSAPPALHTDDLILHTLHLAVFRTVVERQSFTRAAEDWCLTQPTISAHIRALEKITGARLFDRSRRGAHLTEAGRMVYDYAVTIFRETAALRAGLSDLTGGERGTVTLAAGMTLGTFLLPELLADFYHRHPAAQIHLRILPPDMIADDLLHGSIDFGIVSEATAVAHTLQTEPLWSEELVLVAPPEHALARRGAATIAELAGEPFVAGPSGLGRSAGDQALDAALARAGFSSRRVVMEVGHPAGAKTAVLKGVGLAVLFRRVVAAELAAGALVALSVDELPRTEQFRLVHRRAHQFSPLGRRLMQFIRDHARTFAPVREPA